MPINRDTTFRAVAFAVIALAIFAPFLFQSKTFDLYPKERARLSYQCYYDALDDSGNSQAKMSYERDTITLKYRLGSKCPFPFAAINIVPQDLVTPIDITGSRDIELSLLAPTNDDIQIQLLFFAEGFSHVDSPLTYVTLAAKLLPKPGKTHYRVPISDFSVPAWWLNANKLSPKMAPKPNFAKLEMIAVMSPIGTQIEKDISIRLFGVSFLRTQSPFLRFLPSLVLIMLAAVFLLLSFRKALVGKTMDPKYKKNSPSGYTSEESERLVAFIGENYSDQFLSKQKVIIATKLNQTSVDAILAGEFSMGYRQYLNLIRIMEAKRLLSMGNRPIASVASAVGFFYPNSFTRAFKNICGISPTEFRKKSQG